MTGVVLLAAVGAGIGLWLIVVGLWPRPPRLDTVLAVLDPSRHAAPAPVPHVEGGGWAARLGRPAVAYLHRLGLPTASTRRDLATVGKPIEVHLAEQATTAAVGVLLPPGVATLLAMAGWPVGVSVPVLGAALAGGLGFLAPQLALRTQAAATRAAFRHALGSFLDLVVVSLAGGAGVDQALTDAATVGRGRAYTELRYALAEARLARTPVWDTLASLGQRVGVDQLQQLAATVGLAGTEGAKIRASLRSRAAALRARQLADAEADASAATERMSLPIVALMAGFLIFIGYPAVAAVLHGL
ncbi:MAG: type II secretion system F family protein [Pseudonocardiaceae bacterium]